MMCNFEANMMLRLGVRQASFSLVSSFSIDDFHAYMIIDFLYTVTHIGNIFDTWSVIPIMATFAGVQLKFYVQRHNIRIIAIVDLDCM